VIAGAANVISGANQLSDSLAATAPDSGRVAQLLVQVQVVAQGSSAQSLQNAGNGSRAIDDVVAAFSGADLSQAVSNAPVGNLTGAMVQAGAFAFSQQTFTVSQNGTAAPGAVVTVTRTGGNSGPVTGRVTLSGGTATSQGVDYRPGPIEVAFADHEITKTVDLSTNLIANPSMPAGATVNLSLSLAAGSPAGASLGTQNQAVLSLISASSPGTFSFSSGAYSVHEDGSAVTPVMITRSGGNAGAVTVIVAPAEIPGGAVAGRDFVATPIEVTFTDGNMNRLVSIPILNDALLEVNEAFSLGLSLETGAPVGAAIGSTPKAVVTILAPASVVSTWPTASSITYGQTLAASILSGGTASVAGSFSFNSPAIVPGAGVYPALITFTPANTANSQTVSGLVNVSVAKAPLTVKANNATRFYGAANPSFGGTITGVTNGDNITATYVCTATASSQAVTYSIVTSLVDPNNRQTNYTVSVIDGTLTVLPATPTVTWTNPAPVTYGNRLGSVQLNATSSVPGTNVYSPPAGTVLGAGNHTLTVVFTPTDTTNYSSLTTSVTQVVLPARLTITANNVTRSYGVANPALSVDIGGVRNGDAINATCSCDANSTTAAGTYANAIVPTLVDPNNLQTNYQVTMANGTLTVTAALHLNPAPETVGVGQGPMLLDSTASVRDGGSLNFGGGTLTVALATNAAAADSLSIEPSGTNPGQIGLVGNAVTWGGADLAVLAGGVGTNALILSLTTNATSASLTALLQRVAFASLDTNSGTRVVEVMLTYGDITVSAIRPLVVDRLPVANVADIWVTSAATITIPISQVLAFDSSPNGEVLSLESCGQSSALGGQVSAVGTNFIYQPPSLTIREDVLSYVVEDSNGGQTAGTVNVHLIRNGQLQLTVSQSSASGAQLVVGGTPGQAYRIQASVDLVHWTLLETVTAPPTGVIDILDAATQNYPERFYRAVPQ
jgi:hypothetical protein